MLLLTKHRKHRRQSFYGKRESRNSQTRREICRVQSLMKYVNSDTLKESYRKQPKGKAVGIDGITKEEYGENLEENIGNLLVRMKKFSYKPIQCAEPIYQKEMGKCEASGFRHLRTKSCRVSSRDTGSDIRAEIQRVFIWISPKQKLSRCNPESKQAYHGRQSQLYFRC